jgi:hypothetical protein
MEVVGSVPIKVNGKYSVTVTSFSRKKSQNTKQHAGAFGVFGISQGAAVLVSGSFKVSIPKTGFEFKWADEFAGDGGTIVADIPGSRLGYNGVKINEDDLSVDQAQGLTEVTLNWMAQREVPL